MPISTKERIIEAAFSFYCKPIFYDISLSQIAEKVGISKAAIFKHFKNKNDLNEAMKKQVMNEVGVVLGKMQTKYEDMQSLEALKEVIQFLAQKQEYLNYMLFNLPELSEDHLVTELRKEGITLFNTIYDENGNIKSLAEYFKSVFSSTTLIVFLICRMEALESGRESKLEDFTEGLSNLMQNGVKNKDSEIKMLRLAELDMMCKESVTVKEPLNKILVAISSVISGCGFKGITVEKIANELGMAKSSLYTWFDNKAEMIQSLLAKELNNLYCKIFENVLKANNSGEKLYVLLQTEMAYFQERPEILDLCKWLHINGNFSSPRDMEKNCNDWDKMEEIRNFFKEQKLIDYMPKIGITGDTYSMMTGWFFALPVILLIHGRVHNLSKEIMQAAIKDIYYMIEFGIDGHKSREGETK